MGDGRDEGTAAARSSPEEDRRRKGGPSTRERLLSSTSSGCGLSGRLSTLPLGGGDAWLSVEDMDPRCMRGDVEAAPLGPFALDERLISVSATPSS
jgi:hypothetical protein